MIFTRDNIVSLNLSGAADIITCNHCRVSIDIPFEFQPRKVAYETRKVIQQIGRKITKVIKKNEVVKDRKRYLWIFQETHWNIYLDSIKKKPKK